MLLQRSLDIAGIGFNTLFNKVFSETKTIYEKIATIVPSTGSEESYNWLGSLPKLREWVGERHIKNIANNEYTIKNKPFEATISINRYDLEDDKLGLYKPHVESLAQSAKLFPDELVVSLLEKGFNKKCYDDANFFGEHKVKKHTYTNKGTKALSIESYAEARAKLMGIKDEENKSLRIMPNILVVPPALEAVAREILKSDIVKGSTNIYKDTAELIVATELISGTAWYLLDTTKALKPLIFQSRKAPEFVALTDNKDANVFMRKEFLYGVDMRCNVGYGFWQMAYGSTGIV